MNIYFIVILFFLIGSYLVDIISNILNIKNISTVIPAEFKDMYSEEKYKKSQHYLKENTRFNLVQTTINTTLLIGFIVIGGFNTIDQYVRSINEKVVISGLLFFGILFGLSYILALPFKIYHTFVIEKKYEFNNTTYKTFILDNIKIILLTILFGGPIGALIIWYFQSTGTLGWLYAWISITVFQIIMLYLVPSVIMPLFNKFEPLEEGELKTSINNYAKEQQFKLNGIFKMDGSKRSNKANAFFTGFGKFKRVVLFDTLIKNHSSKELVSILAHEIGHFKKKHLLQMLILTILQLGFMLWILSLLISNEGLFTAFKMENISIYAGIIFFSFLYSPIDTFTSILTNRLSRKNEYEADQYAVKTTKDKETLITALKKLSVDNLSNLTPHSIKVLIEYSHPPVIERIKAIKKIRL